MGMNLDSGELLAVKQVNKVLIASNCIQGTDSLTLGVVRLYTEIGKLFSAMFKARFCPITARPARPIHWRKMRRTSLEEDAADGGYRGYGGGGGGYGGGGPPVCGASEAILHGNYIYIYILYFFCFCIFVFLLYLFINKNIFCIYFLLFF